MKMAVKGISFLMVIILMIGMIGCTENTDMAAGQNGQAMPVNESGQDNGIEDAELQESEDTETMTSENEQPITEVYSDKCPTGEPVEALYDLNALPAMENQQYAKWDDKIYFRQYNAESFMDGALWAEYDYVAEPLVPKDLMCMDAQGNITKVGTDYGYGPLYVNDADGNGPRIYSTLLDNDGCYKIYSCDLEGNDLTYLHSDEMYLELCGHYEDKLVFLSGYYRVGCVDLNGGLAHISYLGDFYKEEYLGMNEDGVYYVGHRYTDEADFYICEGSYDGETKVLAEFQIQDIVPDDMLDECTDEEGNLLYFATSYEMTDVDVVGDEIYFILEGYAGTGHFPQGGALFILDMGTKDCKLVSKMSEVIKFNVVAQDGNTWIYYPQAGYVDDEYKVWTECFHLEGEPGTLAPIGADARYDMSEVTQNYYSNGGYDVYTTVDASGYNYVLLTEEEINSLGIDNPTIYGESNCDVEWNMVRAEYVEDKFFFTVEISDRDTEQNVGWRDYYVRRITYDYYKDLSTGEIVLMQSY